MPLLSKVSPNKTINGLRCYANACEAQLPYEFQREDYAGGNISDNGGGFMQYNFLSSVGNVNAEFAIGGSVWIFDPTGVYDKEIYTITGIVFTDPSTRLIFSDAFIAAASGVAINNISGRPGYFVQLQFWDEDHVNILLNNTTFKYFTRPNGKFFIDWGRLVTEYMEERNLLSFTYQMRFTENWEGGVQSWAFTSNTQAVYSWARQLKETGGSNLWQFVSQPTVTDGIANIQDAGGFMRFHFASSDGDLTAFFKVGMIVRFDAVINQSLSRTYVVSAVLFATQTQITVTSAWTTTDTGQLSNGQTRGRALTHVQGMDKRGLLWLGGWKRTVSFLLDEWYGYRYANSISFKVRHEWLDINGVFVDFTNSPGSTTVEPRVLIVNIPYTNAPPTGIHFVNVQGNDANTNERLFGDTVYEFVPECANPIMLDWLNGYGAPEQHLFNISQTFEREAGEGLVFERAVLEDLANTEVTKRRTVRRWVQRMILGADGLTKNQFDTLTELKSSDFVRCYLSKSGGAFVEVIVVGDLTDGGETDEGAYTFRVQIEFPTNFDFFKGKLY